MKSPLFLRLSSAGLFLAAIVWGAHQMLAYLVASWACNGATTALKLAAVAAVFGVLIGGWLTLRAMDALRATYQASAQSRRTRTFLAHISLMAVLLFLFAIVLQVAAVLFLPGCTA